MARSLLLICRQAPWSGLVAREALDIALAGGAFDLPVSLLFLDDGAWQLQTQARPEVLQQKNLSANLQALPLFGIEQLYACQASLEARGLSGQPLALAVEPLDARQIGELLSRHDHVMTL